MSSCFTDLWAGFFPRMTSHLAVSCLSITALAVTACGDIRLLPGQYACDPARIDVCPKGWICLPSMGTGEYRCYPQDDSICGDGAVEVGEECDDGNAVPGDGCSPSCIDEMGSELDCADGLDDDQDGLTDCDDPGCAEHTDCIATREIDCRDSVDNDWDLLVDCDDPDCWADAFCQTGSETECYNGIDDDSDGVTDCGDSDCEGRSCGANGLTCQLGNCTCSTGQTTEVLCSDGVDDDCDGLVDCIDPECAGAPACQGTENVCDDGLDNDSDGSTDCFDVDCGGVQCGPNGQICSGGTCACPGGASETLCTDGQDNDCDGLVDCVDSDCALNPACVSVETNCTNGLDDDNDGPIDCADSDCNGASCGSFGLICSGGVCICPGGTTEVCGNSIDDNCNGQTDEYCGGSCTLPLSPSSECGVGYHCIPQPVFGNDGQCSGPTGLGTQYSFCVDNTSCDDIYECLNYESNLVCLQWCTTWTDCPTVPASDCFFFHTPVYIGSQEWGACAPVSSGTLIISEYVEGSSYNKYLELYNAGNTAVDLGEYQIQVYYNGAVTPSVVLSCSSTMLPPGSVYVIADDGHTLWNTPGPDQVFTEAMWNGNDAVQLVDASNIQVDLVGVIGDAVYFGNDRTFVRNSGVTTGVTGPSWDISEWGELPVDTHQLGSHTP